MKHHIITGGEGCQLHLVETGNPDGQPILFIHGFSQCWMTWSRQLNSDLARNHRLIAMDLRGHGKSDKPRDGYDNSRLWADDVASVIRQLQFSRDGRTDRSSFSTMSATTVRIRSPEFSSSAGSPSSAAKQRCRLSRLSFSVLLRDFSRATSRRARGVWIPFSACASSLSLWQPTSI